MHKWLCILVIFGFLIAADDAKNPGDNKNDLDQMQGKWHAIAIEGKGKAKGADEIKKFTLEVKKDDFSVKVNGEDHVSAKAVLRADKKPKELDLVQETGPTYKGIYEIDGDKFRICVSVSSDADAGRPKEFKTNEDSNSACMTWERER
jgi:uncharacterized protein (TIGR03067 family)